MTKPTCRLFVIFAAKDDSAVIICRHSTTWFHLIKWRTKKDTFEHGAWMRGRIYPEKCDLSPDGELFVYTVAAKPRDPSYSLRWTAVSRSPWLHALALWPQGSHFDGGGRFFTNRMINLRGSTQPHPDHPYRTLTTFRDTCPLHASTDEIPKADWSGRDQRGNLVYSLKGKLIRRTKRNGDLELADFSKLIPDPQPPPEWAKKPL